VRDAAGLLEEAFRSAGILGYIEERSFSELGGDSIAAVQVIERVRERTGKSIPLSAFFDGTTVRSLIRLISEKLRE
jgi:acyl carrier protein